MRNLVGFPDHVTRVYIAGKMRGLPRFNFDAFDHARDWLIEYGLDPVNPADLDRAVGITGWTTDLPEDFIYSALRRDFIALCSCDAIALMPGWETSLGAKAEYQVASWIGLVVFYLDPETGTITLKDTENG